MKKYLVGLALGATLFGIVGNASAVPVTIFEDNFDTENYPSGGQFSYDNFTNWDVVGGSVDLKGYQNGGRFYGNIDMGTEHGLYLDMDGATGSAGRLTLKTGLNLEAGDYELKFDLAGNQRLYAGESDTMTVLVWEESESYNLVAEEYTLSRYDPFTTFSQTFSFISSTTIRMSFQDENGGDNMGVLLDNVILNRTALYTPPPENDPVPEPATMLLFGTGLAGLLGGARKRKRSSV